MADSARLAKLALQARPTGLQLSLFRLRDEERVQIESALDGDAVDSAYAAAVSYVEAVAGLDRRSIAWSVIKLYYTSFYCIRAFMLINAVIPFNGGGEYIFGLPGNTFFKGGQSSHVWNWNVFERITALRSQWVYSEDSRKAYERLRGYREDVNYRHYFTDPDFHECLNTGDERIAKRIRAYRDDASFFYTYLDDHLAIAYPTKLIFFLHQEFSNRALGFSEEQTNHLRSVWPLRDRCPLTGSALSI